MKAYYDRRAPEYDEWYLGSGRFAGRDRLGWDEEIEALRRTLEALPPARTLDVACGTGFLTRHLPGEIVGLDQSESMLEEARGQAPNATYLTGDALSSRVISTDIWSSRSARCSCARRGGSRPSS